MRDRREDISFGAAVPSLCLSFSRCLSRRASWASNLGVHIYGGTGVGTRTQRCLGTRAGVGRGGPEKGTSARSRIDATRRASSSAPRHRVTKDRAEPELPLMPLSIRDWRRDADDELLVVVRLRLTQQ